MFSLQKICALKSRIMAQPVGIPEAADAPAPRNQATRFGLSASAVAKLLAEIVLIVCVMEFAHDLNQTSARFGPLQIMNIAQATYAQVSV